MQYGVKGSSEMRRPENEGAAMDTGASFIPIKWVILSIILESRIQLLTQDLEMWANYVIYRFHYNL